MCDQDLSAYDFDLDPSSIAQHPTDKRDASRLLILSRKRGSWTEKSFAELPSLLQSGDLLVLNDALVAPARLYGTRPTGGKVELLLLAPAGEDRWSAMARAARKLRPGERISIEGGVLELTVVERIEGLYLVSGLPGGWESLAGIGRAPLPPYIKRTASDPHRAEDLARYQTIYASAPGAVAAPTAGLHFTREIFDRLAEGGIQTASVSLTVGLGTFLPVKTERITDHPMHAEAYTFPRATAEKINAARAEGRRVIAVGTTSCRVLETIAREQSHPFQAASGMTRLFLHPPHKPLLTDALLTNFHLPKSTLLMLISSLAGRELVLRAYAHAREAGFRFYSYGDAMLIL